MVKEKKPEITPMFIAGIESGRWAFNRIPTAWQHQAEPWDEWLP
ncbi:hypothetical protein [Paenibacillus sp. FSL E2-0201]